MGEAISSVIEKTQTSQDEGALCHIVCCATESDDITIRRALCGALIDDPAPPDYTTDDDCEKCEALNKTTHCPLFGECLEQETA